MTKVERQIFARMLRFMLQALVAAICGEQAATSKSIKEFEKYRQMFEDLS